MSTEIGNILLVKTKGITKMIRILEIAYRRLLGSDEVYIRQEVDTGVTKIEKEGFVTIRLNVVNRNEGIIRTLKVEAELTTGSRIIFNKVPVSHHELEWEAYLEVPNDDKELFVVSEIIEDIFNRDVSDYRREDKHIVHMEWVCVNIPLYTHYLMQRVAKKINGL